MDGRVINLDEKYLTLAYEGSFKLVTRFSLSFHDALIIVVMHFATFVAFMLPLAALAAPPLTPRQSSVGFSAYKLAYLDAVSAISAVVDQLNGGATTLTLNGHRETYIQSFRTANISVNFGFNATSRLDEGVSTNVDVEYVDSLCTYTMVKK